MRSKFSCMHSSHDLRAHAHAHSLEGTLLQDSISLDIQSSILLRDSIFLR